jgi:hypothetical protein
MVMSDLPPLSLAFPVTHTRLLPDFYLNRRYFGEMSDYAIALPLPQGEEKVEAIGHDPAKDDVRAKEQ